jgi:hypothetical protein
VVRAIIELADGIRPLLLLPRGVGLVGLWVFATQRRMSC